MFGCSSSRKIGSLSRLAAAVAVLVAALALIASPALAEGGYTFVTKWGSFGSGDGQFNFPEGIAVDGSGNVYVADNGNDRVDKFDSTGTFLTKWGSSGSGNGQFDFPAGIAADGSGNVYVTDANNNNRVQKFNSTGTFLTKWGSSGSGDGQFDTPGGAVVDQSGNVYVADANNFRIQKFNSTGTFLTKWGSSGSGDGEFQHPYGVTVNGSGIVYVADSDNHRIQEFAPYSASILPDNPVGYWRFGESSGTIAHDSADANDGTYLGGFRLGQPGIGDTAVALDGQTGYVRVPDSTSLHTGDTFSLEVWLKRNYLSSYNGTEGLFLKGYQVFLDGGNFGSGGWVVLRKPNVDVIAKSTLGITDRSFHHVVVTKAGPSVHLYIDGTDVTGTVGNRTIDDTTGSLSIGNGGARPFRGVLDEAAVYNYALTSGQVAAHVAAGH
jgi:hypothetical protein